MERSVFCLLLGITGLLLSDCSLMERYRIVSRENPLPASPDNLARGAKLYGTHCQTCHGANGEGDGPGRGELPVSNLAALGEKSDGIFSYYIQYGKNEQMPPFREILTQEQVDQVVLYLRKLQQR